MGGISFLLVVIGVILYYFWYKYKDKVKQKNLRIPIYILLIGLVPMLSYLFLYFIITNSSLDFYEYIIVLFITCAIFICMWIFFALYGEEKKVELSMYIVLGAVAIIFMLFMALIEVLPNDILEFYLKPLISKGNEYDIWSRPPYQLAHFLTFSFSFPYIASFVVSKIILKYKRYKNSSLTTI
ncbi:hypothetical protein [Clostridium omnivorum]|uniref:Uncharacterized protein n=1 Tax=Clostridium omnivorum TaxID=1604902 RepID=A0ABQ5N1W0_9CLOT|nr:hypothetical protein [Clostridium sp. E14]GLC29176.1 hypothetical protein bsdE14_05860 [Clostridium sp. E14]